MITAFYHVGPINHWREVVAEQFRILASTSFTGHIYVHFGGPEDQSWFIQRVADVHELNISFLPSQPNRNESPALEAAQKYSHACKEEANILYFHTKGITHLDDWTSVQWRWMMNAVLLADWEKAERVLVAGKWDFVGPQIFGGSFPHSSGNFWLATSAHIRRLELFADYYRKFLPRHHGRLPHGWENRHADEAWIGSSPDLRCHQLMTYPVVMWNYNSWVENPDAQTYATLYGS